MYASSVPVHRPEQAAKNLFSLILETRYFLSQVSGVARTLQMHVLPKSIFLFTVRRSFIVGESVA